jgi:mRNA interferase MazF
MDPLPSDLVLASNDPNFAAIGLRVTSTVRLHRMTTIAVPTIRRELGRIGSNYIQQVNQRLVELFHTA